MMGDHRRPHLRLRSRRSTLGTRFSAPTGSAGLGLKLVTRLVEVELVGAEPQGATAGAEGDRLHAEHADIEVDGIEVDGLVDVGDGED